MSIERESVHCTILSVSAMQWNCWKQWDSYFWCCRKNSENLWSEAVVIMTALG